MNRVEHIEAQRAAELSGRSAFVGQVAQLKGIGKVLLLPDHAAAREGKTSARVAYRIDGHTLRRLVPKIRGKKARRAARAEAKAAAEKAAQNEAAS